MEYKGFTYTPAPKTAWDNLSMLEKSEIMKVAVRNGITDLKTIREKYNEFAEGGYLDWKEKASKYKHLDIDNDRTYDYEGWYNENPQRAWNFLNDSPDAHFDDKYKTVYHPTFSTQSKYSGVVDPVFNPDGLIGGTWNNQGTVFTMSPDGYRGPASMDERKWYLENAEDNGVQLREADGSLPVFDGIPWGGVLPNVTVTGNRFAKGGGIHIKDSKKGTFTAAASRHNMGVQEFASKVLANKDDYSPAMVRKANFARNARHWKHGLRGNLFDGTSEPTQQMNVMAYHPVEDYFTGPSATMPEINVTRKGDGKTYVGLGDFSKRYDRQKERPYFVSSRTGQLTAGDAMKGIDAATGPLLHWMQPSQYVGAVRDAVEGKNPLTSMLRGNSGVVSEEYAQEHPVISTLLNLGTDLAVPVTANSNLLRESGKFGMPMGVPNGLTRTVYAIATRKPMPLPLKQAAARRMKEFIHSEDYISRQKNAGLSDEAISDFQNMVERRLNDGNFPAYYSNIKSDGRSLVLPKPLGGVYIRKDIQPDDFLNVLDHEVAHYSTVNFTKGENKLHEWINKENPAVVEDMMKHNEAITPYRPESDVVNIRRARGLDADANWLMVPENRRRLEYFRNEQELRSNGYAMIQEAQRRGITVDDLVDQYTMQSTGEIFGHAPKPLRYMNYAYTPDQIKSFLKGLLSLSIPVALNTKNKDDQENNKFH